MDYCSVCDKEVDAYKSATLLVAIDSVHQAITSPMVQKKGPTYTYVM